MSQKITLLAGAALLTLLVTLGLALEAGGGAQAALQGTPTLAPVEDPVLGDFDPTAVAEIDLDALPLVPEIGERARLIYLDALAQGRDPHAFAKVGDCMTDNPNFLIPIGEGDYALGEYEDLAGVIEQFSAGDLNSFSRQSQAAAGGFNTASILDSMWANPEFCAGGESPLACEFRLVQPSIALIMFGTNDVFYLDETQFDYFLRSILAETIRSGVLPILSTFPLRPEFPDESIFYNQIVAQAAQDYDIPLINLYVALEPLPNQGIDEEETTHMTAPEGGAACYFIGPNMQAGFTVRNLLTLQALDAVLQSAAE